MELRETQNAAIHKQEEQEDVMMKHLQALQA
jgi:hypothetical protein